MPKLIIQEKGTDKKEVVEFSHEGVSIGRSGDNQVKLATSAVSRKHANIVVSGNACFLIDLGSGNGTFLNGVKVQPNERTILKHGDTISIENYNLNFHHLDEILASSFNEVTDSDILEVKLLKKVLKAIDKERVPSLEVLNGSFVGKKSFVTDDVEEMIIGREDTADFQIEEYVISRQHVKIINEGAQIVLEDLNSKNGTYINNRRVTKEVLHDGDRIALGTIVLIFRNPKEVSMEDISARAKMEKKRALARVPQKYVPQPPQEMPESSTDEELSSATEEGAFGDVNELPAETPDYYPAPRPIDEKISLSLFEIGLIGFGILIFIFAIISFVNLVTK